MLVDNAIEADYHRPFRFQRTAPTVLADIYALPFRDGLFDYSICSHVLEHLEDPEAAARELSRVSRAGYVETPSDLHEKLFPMVWHRWMVRREGDHLRFEAKPSPLLDERLGQWFFDRWEKDASLMRFIWSHTDDLFVQHRWSGRLRVETVGKPAEWFTPEEADEALKCEHALVVSPGRRRVYDTLARWRYPRRPR